MVKKCCVYGCNVNYLSTLNKNENASKTVYRFPKDKDERQRWIDVVGKINANLKVTSETLLVVCELHWPHGYETVRKKGKNGQSILRPSSKEYLTQITSKVSKLVELDFLQQIFNSIEENQKDCTILFDEVYVKQMLYHGGTIFGKACNNPSLLANTVLGIMVDCMYGGPTFLLRMLPVAKLNSEFLIEQISETIISIKTSGGTLNSLICDNDRTNQKFFKSFPTLPNKPWLTTDGLFMLFDYVHITKSIRNIWLTEKLGELAFKDNNIQKTVKWSHLVKLYQLESQSLLKLSKLNAIAVAPKPVERQSVHIV